MKRRLDELMQTVLDGEATPDEASELDRRLAGDAPARARFEEFRGLFAALSRMRKAYPPEGLVASVLANIPQNPPPAEREDQLFVAPGVIEASSRKARAESQGRGKRVFQRWAFSRGREMNEQKGGVGAAPLRARRCGGCSLELTAADLGAIAKAPTDEVLRCEECDRILVRTSESGV